VVGRDGVCEGIKYKREQVQRSWGVADVFARPGLPARPGLGGESVGPRGVVVGRARGREDEAWTRVESGCASFLSGLQRLHGTIYFRIAEAAPFLIIRPASWYGATVLYLERTQRKQ